MMPCLSPEVLYFVVSVTCSVVLSSMSHVLLCCRLCHMFCCVVVSVTCSVVLSSLSHVLLCCRLCHMFCCFVISVTSSVVLSSLLHGHVFL